MKTPEEDLFPLSRGALASHHKAQKLEKNKQAPSRPLLDLITVQPQITANPSQRLHLGSFEATEIDKAIGRERVKQQKEGKPNKLPKVFSHLGGKKNHSRLSVSGG